MYRAYALLQPDSEFTNDEAVRRLEARFTADAVTRSGGQITVRLGEWEIELKLNEEAYVVTESIALAEKIAGLVDGIDMESCHRRVEIWSETPDPFVEHLADFHTVIEVMKSFRGAILVDPGEPALM